jgi:ubiquinone/menaquinone biosynthesis C-methylase UbiE
MRMPKFPTNQELRASYDKHFREDDLRDTDSYYRWVLRKLQPQAGQRLLDVACGSGRLLYFARQAHLQSIGLDFSFEGLKVERRLDPATRLILADGQDIPLISNSVDFLTNLGSLEHFVDPERGVHEMARVLKPEGVAAIVLPNAFYAVDLVWWVWRKGRSAHHKQILERFAAHDNWRELLEDNGLKVFRSYAYNFMLPRGQADWTFYRRRPRKLLYLLVAPFIPFNFSFSFLFLCRKAADHE